MHDAQVNSLSFSHGYNSFRAAGGLSGIKQLVDDFYSTTQTLPSAKNIPNLQAIELSETKKQLIRFLSGWLGGPSLHQTADNPIDPPNTSHHLPSDKAERDAWLTCMRQAIGKQPYTEEFKRYLISQFEVPTERTHVGMNHS